MSAMTGLERLINKRDRMINNHVRLLNTSVICNHKGRIKEDVNKRSSKHYD
jgi:hypothetical protein